MIEDVGGKARSLHRLGVRTPSWFAVTASAFHDAVRGAGVESGIRDALAALAADGNVDAARAELVPLLERVEPDARLRSAIGKAYRDLGGGHVAVRSSALDEDGAASSFAGCMETHLFQSGEDEVIEAVRRCWLSGFSERALAYRATLGALDRTIAVAVVIQRMIGGQVSGVYFTADPTGRPAGVLTSTWGLGEGVVSGVLSCDTYRVEPNTGRVLERDIVDKSHAIERQLEGNGTHEVEVPAGRREVSSLTDGQIERIARAGRAIEASYGHPVDIEWILEGDALWILQARPITTIPRGRRRLWDNSNIVESYSGVTTPLTYSFARHAYAIVYRQALEALGVSRADIDANAEIFEQMIGLLNGRVYYSLESWYRLFMLLPGYRFNAEFMEQMMGVREQATYASDPDHRLLDVPRLIGQLSRLTARVARSETLVEDFFANFESAYRELSARDIESMSFDELVTEYHEAERRLLHRWQAPIINDILAMVFYGSMRRAIGAWLGGDAALQNDLLCGEGGLESTAPTRDLLTLMVRVRQQPELVDVLRSHSAAESRAVIECDPRFCWLKEAIAAHVARYGDRCIDELKLETPTLRDDPTFVYGSLKAYLGAPPVTVEELEQRERRIRAAAEARVRSVLSGRPARWRLFRWLMARSRLHVKNRENLRFARTRAFGLVRRLVVAMGHRLHEAGKLDDPRDVFWLEIEELIAFARGTATSTDLRGLAAVRTREYEAYRSMPAPEDRLYTTGAAYLDPQLVSTSATLIEDPVITGEVLSGTAASPGVVRASARIVTDPRVAVLDREVLVAHRTDPGWVPLFPSAAAVVVERGSVLSHSAIVAREFGIPCVVGLENATARLTNGAMIEVDGNTGRVTVLDSA